MRKNALATGAAGLILPAILHGALVQSSITGSGNLIDTSTWSNWHTAANWTPAIVPNNSFPKSYAASVSGGVVHRAATPHTTLDELSIGPASRLLNEGSIFTQRLNTAPGGFLLNSGAQGTAQNVDNRGIITAVNSNLSLNNVRNEGSIIAGPGSSIDVSGTTPGLLPGYYTASGGFLRLSSLSTIHGNVVVAGGSVALRGTLNGSADISHGSLGISEASIIGSLNTQEGLVFVEPVGTLNLFSPFRLEGGGIHVAHSAVLGLFPTNAVNVNNGSISLNSSTLRLANGDDVQLEYVLEGSGLLSLSGGRVTNQIFGNTAPVFVNGPNHTIRGNGSFDVLTLNRGNIYSEGNVSFSAGFDNQGTLDLPQGSVTISGGWRNLNAGTLSGGSYTIGGRLTDLEDGVLVTNAARIVLSGDGDILRYDGASSLRTLQHNAGSLQLFSPAVNVASDFTNTGDLALGGDLTLGSDPRTATFRQTAGAVLGFGLASITAGNIEVEGGDMQIARLFGDVHQTGGQIFAGVTTGTLEIFGDFTQEAGRMHFTLTPFVSDQAFIHGHASLNGLLTVLLLHSSPPSDGFQLISWAGYSGRFRDVVLPENWFLDYRSNGLYLSLNSTPTPEPATFLLSGIVLAADGLWRRRRASK